MNDDDILDLQYENKSGLTSNLLQTKRQYIGKLDSRELTHIDNILDSWTGENWHIKFLEHSGFSCYSFVARLLCIVHLFLPVALTCLVQVQRPRLLASYLARLGTKDT